MAEPLPVAAGAGGWDVRHLPSHPVGAWQRVVVHAGFLPDEGVREVPIQLDDPYWIAEWETAPLAAFRAALEAAYAGNQAFLRQLDPGVLAVRRATPFGELSLGELLVLRYRGHIDEFHLPQLEGFIA